MNIKKKFGKRLKELRLSKGLTQEKLAEDIKMSAKSLSQIELGNNFVSSETLEELCAALNATPKILFDFEYVDEQPIDLLDDIIKRLESNPNRLKELHKILIALEN